MKKQEIFIVAGEVSGDQLAAGLIAQLKLLNPNYKFTGIGGSLMQAEGLDSIIDMEKLEVFGFVAVLKKLPELLLIRRKVKLYLEKNRPAIYIGIDAPDFNLPVEKYARKDLNLKTIHYVSPSVWAWREGRVKHISRAVDHLLCILPFEEEFYKPHNVKATYIGHRLAKSISSDLDHNQYKLSLLNEYGIKDFNTKVICLVAGSRKSEIEQVLEIYIQSVIKLAQQVSVSYLVVVPIAREGLKEQFTTLFAKYQKTLYNLKVQVAFFDGCIHRLASASDIGLVTSGTATLDLMLCHLPMVVGYRLSKVNYAIYSRLVTAKYVSLVNLIFDTNKVPELLQDNCNPEQISKELIYLIENESLRNDQRKDFIAKHQMMILDSDQIAAKIVNDLVVQSINESHND